jgi:hypothetical protein
MHYGTLIYVRGVCYYIVLSAKYPQMHADDTASWVSAANRPIIQRDMIAWLHQELRRSGRRQLQLVYELPPFCVKSEESMYRYGSPQQRRN